MSEIDAFFRRVVERFSVTDAMFLIIQNDKELMKEYLDLVGSENYNLQEVNMRLGKLIQELGLTNRVGNNSRNDNPVSTLIQTHQYYESPDNFSWIK